jgi:hypothetical protein
MTMTLGKRILGLIWFIGGLIPIVFLYVQDSYFEKYGEKGEEVWNWLLPMVVPTITLIIGVYVYDFFQNKNNQQKTGEKDKEEEKSKNEFKKVKVERVDKFIFSLTIVLTIGYLLLVNSIIFLEPYSPDTIFEQISESRTFWGTLQLLVNPLVGIFFASGGKKGG